MKKTIGGLAATIFPIRLGRETLQLWLPDNAEEYILNVTEEKFGQDERLPYWAILWPASLALAEFLEKLDFAPSTTFLELGAGLALPSLLIAKKGGNAIATDWYVEAMEYAMANAAANGCQLDAKILDWRCPPENLQFDHILGADILYEFRNHQPVLEVLETLLKPAGKAFISDPNRHRMPEFVERAEQAGWNILLHPIEVVMEGQATAVTIYELQRR